MSDAAPSSSRLAAAVRLSVEFRAAGRTDIDAFLAAHDDVRELLEPMLRYRPQPDDGADDFAARMPAPQRLEAGAWLGGYRLLHELGRGGMGTVWAAWQRSLARTVAVKVISARTLLVSEQARARFAREGQLLATLDHPGIVKVIEAAVDGDQPFLAMDLVPGTSLAAVLQAVQSAGSAAATGATIRAAVLGGLAARFASATPDGDRPPLGAPGVAWRLPDDYDAAVVAIVTAVADALEAAHRVGVVHRDLKPSNILVRRDGVALLADFGVAHQDGAATLTQTDDLPGTTSYMAPELLRGEPASAKSDVFSLGVVAYEALTLQQPFASTDREPTAQRVLQHEPTELHRLRPQAGRALAAVVHKALAKPLEHRYASAAAFAADLLAAAAGEATVARPLRLHQRVWRAVRREPWRALAMAIAVAALTALLTVDRLAAGRLAEVTDQTVAALTQVQQLELGVRLDRALAQGVVDAAQGAVPTLTELPARLRWLRDDAEPLAAALPGLERALAELRAQALPYGADDAARDRHTHPESHRHDVAAAELAWLEQQPTGARASNYAARCARLREQIAEVAPRLTERRTWRFAEDRQHYLHDGLVRLVARLQQFAAADGQLAAARRSTEFAVENHRRCLDEPLALWQTIAADVAADPRFAGLALRPQVDLVPLGKSPQGYWEFVHLPTGETAQQVPPRAADGALVPTEGSGIVLVLLPGGTFTLGAQKQDPALPNYDPAAVNSEMPTQRVELAPFFCGKYEISQAQWLLITGDDPSVWSARKKIKGASPLAPVESVAQKRAASELRTQRLALPTEAQWEYACRAGTTTPFSFADRADAPRYANFGDRSSGLAAIGRAADADLDDGVEFLAPIGTFLPNGFGLHDMHGNVSEHVADALAPLTRPRRPGRGEATPDYFEVQHATRGGHAAAALTHARSAARARRPNATGDRFTGIRAVRPLDP